MPLIQSKKHKTEQYVDIDTWKIFQDSGRARLFVILDDSDIHDTVIPQPHGFAETIGPTVENFSEPEMSREDLKKWLDDHNVEYNTRTITGKLYQLYLDNK